MKEMITADELANRLGVTRQSIYNWRKKGLPYTKIGRIVRFDVEEVQQWIKKQNK